MLTPHHPGFDTVLELARRFAGTGEDGSAIAVRRAIGHFDGGIQVVKAHDVEHGPKNFLARHGHSALHVVQHGGAHKKTIGRIGHFHAAAIDGNFRALLRAGVNQLHDAVAMLPGDDRSHVGLGFAEYRSGRL